jgi:nicotinamidase-related amidase
MRDLRKFSSENRAIEDFKKLFYFSNNGKKLAIICIDLQASFFTKIFKKNKQLPKLVDYSKKIRELSIKNNIMFFDVTYSGKEKSIFFEENMNLPTNTNIKLLEKGGSSAVNSLELVPMLLEKKLDKMYVFGLFRDRCVLETIDDFINEKKGFKIITSFLGTTSLSDFEKKSLMNEYFEKGEVETDFREQRYRYQKLHFQNGDKKYKFSNEIKILKNKGVLILDYYYKNKDGKVTSDLEEFSGR